MRKILKKFYDIYFSSYGCELWGYLENKSDITRKIKIGNLGFLFIQPIPDLSCKFEKFPKKKILQILKNVEQNFNFFWWRAWPPNKK